MIRGGRRLTVAVVLNDAGRAFLVVSYQTVEPVVEFSIKGSVATGGRRCFPRRGRRRSVVVRRRLGDVGLFDRLQQASHRVHARRGSRHGRSRPLYTQGRLAGVGVPHDLLASSRHLRVALGVPQVDEAFVRLAQLVVASGTFDEKTLVAAEFEEVSSPHAVVVRGRAVFERGAGRRRRRRGGDGGGGSR